MENWNFLGMTVFEMYYYFWFWSITGWFIEVVDRTLETGGFENRGFMNGPYCPIYGIGVIGIVYFLTPINSLFVVFAASSFMCTAFELAVGLMLEAVFHAKWWDYSDMKFNFKGYICLRNSILWGVGCVLVVRVVQPLVEKGISYIPYTFGNVIAVIMSIIFIYDLVESVCEVRNLNNKLREIDHLARIIHDKSIALGEKISDEVLVQKAKYDKISDGVQNTKEKITGGVQNTKEKITGGVQNTKEKITGGVQNTKEKITGGVQNTKEKIADELNMTRLKYELLIEQTKKQSRLIKAFPTMKSTRYNNALKAIREKLNIKK